MHPILFKIGPISIYSYGVMLAIAFIVSTFLAARQAKKQGSDPQIIWDFCFWVLIFGIIGARLAYIIINFSYFLSEPKEIFMLQHGGLVWYGGLTLGTLGGIIYLKKKSLNILKYADLIAPFIALAQAIGRLGCFLNGCCFGRTCGWGIYFPTHREILIPTQLISSFILLVIFFILRLMQKKTLQPGIVFFSYLLLYSVKRFFIEFLRADSPLIIFGLTGFQIMSLTLGVIAGILFFSRLNRK